MKWKILASIFVLLCISATGSALLLTRQQPKISNIPVHVLPNTVADKNQQSQSFTILFGGDLMFDRSIRQSMEKNGEDFILSPLEDILAQHDLVIANLEGPITTFPSKSVGSAVGSTNNFIFTFPTSVAPLLKKYHFTHLSLANNHIHNFGAEGIDQTKKFLHEAELSSFGNTGQEKTPEERVLIFSHEGRNIALVGINQFSADGFRKGEEDIVYANQKTDLVIVLPHWGNEYQTHSGKVIEEYAHNLVNLGADLIVGSHPHVIQQTETYQGTPIYYSLGNFVFDQYFEPAVRQGLLLSVTVEPDNQFTFEEIAIELKPNGQTVPVQKTDQ